MHSAKALELLPGELYTVGVGSGLADLAGLSVELPTDGELLGKMANWISRIHPRLARKLHAWGIAPRAQLMREQATRMEGWMAGGKHGWMQSDLRG